MNSDLIDHTLTDRETWDRAEKVLPEGRAGN
jgi:hypothetical protein